MFSSTRNRLKMHVFGFPCTWAIISHHFPPFYDFAFFPQNFEKFRSGDPPVHRLKVAPITTVQAMLSANSGPSKLENCSISFPKTMRDRYTIWFRIDWYQSLFLKNSSKFFVFFFFKICKSKGTPLQPLKIIIEISNKIPSKFASRFCEILNRIFLTPVSTLVLVCAEFDSLLIPHT